MTTGIHHVTAVASSAQRTVAFYSEVLGLRLVKKTVNFDDPGAYHLYFGDREGHPGTILTFFVWPNMPRGTAGRGKAASISFRAPRGSLADWRYRLESHRISSLRVGERFGEQTLSLQDPDGLDLQLVGSPDAPVVAPWSESTIDTSMAIRGLHSVRLIVGDSGASAQFLGETMGLRPMGQESGVSRFASGTGNPQSPTFVDLERSSNGGFGFVGTGSVHHVAWRTPDEESQLQWRSRLVGAGSSVTEPIDRVYFRSIYFREPGGVLFEIATDTPGFAVDEPVELLGSSLKLPAWLEPERRRIEAALRAL